VVLSQTVPALAGPKAVGTNVPKAKNAKPSASKTAPPSRFGSAGSASNAGLVRTALSFRGARYRYGGSSRSGFDCSGFTKYLYSTEKGVSLPRTAAAQFRYGRKINPRDMQPGDLLFFRSRGRRVGHVGIYVGNDRMMHASNPRGGVKLDRVFGGFWGKRLTGVRRPS
jgi:cell wall-associated NlpC family hydrolase